MRTVASFLLLAVSALAQLTPVIPNASVQGAANLTTVGAVPYVSASGVLSSDTLLVWDSTNKRLGVRNSSPTARLHIGSSGGANTDTGLIVYGGNGGAGTSVATFYTWAGVAGMTVGGSGIVTFNSQISSPGISSGGPVQIQGGGVTPVALGNGGALFVSIYGTGSVSLGEGASDSGYRLGVLKSGVTGTALFHDQTATTGITLVKVAAGAGQSTNDLVQIANNAGTKQWWMDSSYAQHGNTWYTLNNAAQALMLRSTAGIAWATTANSDSGTYGTGLSGNIPGLVTVSNGIVGNANASIQAEWHLVAGITTIASASTIAPTKSIIRVTGSTTIQTITAPSIFQSYTGAQLIIIPDTGATWATNTSGNIAVASTAVVGKPLIMVYDAYVSKWYPSY